ncbi:MAG TPA: hypothetical protein VG456_28000 [Candidatus Sulfopaludibacter sp.]|jgi:hypothetical protein|nr:hypothetical protein [Candidatus Sulfopaludibacter sp.]
MTYDAKFNWWLAAAIVAALTVVLLGGDYWIAGPVLIILLICAYPQSYRTTPEGLLVRAFCMKILIPYEVITFVGPSDENRWTSGGVTVRYGLASKMHIAPARMDLFLADVAMRTPHLVRRGPALVLSFA